MAENGHPEDLDGFTSRMGEVLRQVRDGEVDHSATSRRRLAAAARAIAEELTTTGASEEVFADVADQLERAAATLRAEPHGRPYWGVAESSLSRGPASTSFVEFSPMIGRSNPLAPPMDFEMVGDELIGRVRFGSAYEGPPGHVHGGFVAAAFDEVLGFVQSTTGSPGMTGRLTVHYRKPTPLHRDLRFDGRVISKSGRKIFTEATLRDGDVLCAEAEGLFISINFDKFDTFVAKRRGQGSQD
jgi:acyl-coenzyme A thioesterase PaaI-like protein